MENWRKRPNWENLWECLDLRIMTSYLRFSQRTTGIWFPSLNWCYFQPPWVGCLTFQVVQHSCFDPVDLATFSLKQWVKYQNTMSVLWIFPFHPTAPFLSCFHPFFFPTSTVLIFLFNSWLLISVTSGRFKLSGLTSRWGKKCFTYLFSSYTDVLQPAIRQFHCLLFLCL